MEIKTTVEGTQATLEAEGKLTVNTSPDLTAAVEALPEEVCDVNIDLSKLDYIASAGLRVFVATEKLASARGGALHLLHPVDDVMEVLEMTGLADVFDIVR